MASSPALEQMSTGRLYAALLTKLESDKAELERERDFLKKELAVQTFRNRKLEKAMEELKRAAQETAAAQRQEELSVVVNSCCNSESGYSESDTADTELERTPAASPEMRAVTIPSQPVPLLPLCTAIAEDSIPERFAGPSHETGGVVPQPQPIVKDDTNISDGYSDLISNWGNHWSSWESPNGGALRKGKLVELPGGVKTTFLVLYGGIKVWLIQVDASPERGYYMNDPRYILLNYRCRIKCECGLNCANYRGVGDMDSILRRLTIVGDEMHLDEAGPPAAADLGRGG